MSANQIQSARDWLKECQWADMEEEDFNELTDEQITQGIARHYVGGVEQFIKDL